MPSGPTSPLIMPCPTPAHSPAPPRTKPSPPSGHSNGGNGGCEFSQFTFDDTSLFHKFEEMASSTSTVHNASSTNNKILKSPPSNALASTSSTTIIASSSSKATTSSSSAHSSSSKSTTTTTTSTTSTTTATQPSKSPVQKITRQQIKDLPPIPKFKKNYPILRRQTSTGAPVVPKLLSLELFNPETDDLDSDSSEPSSPDSIDSVISALRPSVSPQPSTAQQQPTQAEAPSIPPLIEAAAVVAHKLEDTVELVIRESETKPKQLNGLPKSQENPEETNQDDTSCRQHLVDFAEKLSAQLLKELDNEKQNSESSFDDDDDVFSESRFKKNTLTLADSQSMTDPYLKKLNGDLRDLNLLRAELRERRLMLANLSHIGSSGLGGSNDSLGPSYGSSMTPIIQEETDDDEELNDAVEPESDDSDSLHSLRGNIKNLNKNDEFVIIPELDEDDADLSNDTALLIQEEDSTEEHLQNIDVDLLDGNNSNNNSTNDSHSTSSSHSLPNKTINLSSTQLGVNICNSQQHKKTECTFTHGSSNHSKPPSKVLTAGVTCVGESSEANNSKKLPETNKSSIESHTSVDSWAHSTSSASLDSPSVGGAATHHRYYHVFREGELDALINHHVASLHIVSSYYERASWCVVAEKVQVWTI